MPLFGRKKEVKETAPVQQMQQPAPVEKLSDPIEMLKRSVEIPMPKQSTKQVAMPVEVKIEQPLLPQKQPEEKHEEQQKEKTTFAPLFVKIDRYKHILDTLTELKTTIVTIKNAFVVLNELESLKDDSFKSIQNAIDKMDKRLIALDSEFLRPTGFHEEFPPEMYSRENLEGVLEDLKTQVEELRSQMQTA